MNLNNDKKIEKSRRSNMESEYNNNAEKELEDNKDLLKVTRAKF
jgi:hypothetical protein